MENDPIRDSRLQEMMEAYRPGRDDLADPEMASLARELAASPELADLHERLQRFDAALAAAFRDVPVPEGLQSRILARLASKAVGSGDPFAEPIAVGHDQNVVGDKSVVRVPSTLRRRWLFAVGGLAAAAAAVLVLIFGLLRPTGMISRSDLLAGAIECFLNEPPAGGQIYDPSASLSLHPLSTTLLGTVSGQVSVIRWRPAAGFLGQNADVFDLIGPEGRIAAVYAGTFPVEGLPTEVPLHAMLSTGETSVSVWQEGDVVYVIVVIGGERAYERLFGASTGPLT